VCGCGHARHRVRETGPFGGLAPRSGPACARSTSRAATGRFHPAARRRAGRPGRHHPPVHPVRPYDLSEENRARRTVRRRPRPSGGRRFRPGRRFSDGQRSGPPDAPGPGRPRCPGSGPCSGPGAEAELVPVLALRSRCCRRGWTRCSGAGPPHPALATPRTSAIRARQGQTPVGPPVTATVRSACAAGWNGLSLSSGEQCPFRGWPG